MLVDFVNKDGKKDSYHLADWTWEQMKKIKKNINKKDTDYVAIVDGLEGGGKSTFATQLAKSVDPTFNEERMCLKPDELIEQINKAGQGQAIVFDEAFTGLASRRALSQVNSLIVELMMEMRKKNLFVIICIPSVFYLEKYVALHRARALFHCYLSKGRRGQYLVYNHKKLKQLYLMGKRTMSYSRPRVNVKQRFPSCAPIDWEKYEGRKISALKAKDRSTRSQKHMAQRDFLIYYLHDTGFSAAKIGKLMKDNNYALTSSAIRDIIIKMKPDFTPGTLEMSK